MRARASGAKGMETTSAPLPGSSPDEMFPVLTPEQQARVLAHGRLRKAVSGETIVEPSTPGGGNDQEQAEDRRGY